MSASPALSVGDALKAGVTAINGNQICDALKISRDLALPLASSPDKHVKRLATQILGNTAEIATFIKCAPSGGPPDAGAADLSATAAGPAASDDADLKGYYTTLNRVRGISKTDRDIEKLRKILTDDSMNLPAQPPAEETELVKLYDELQKLSTTVIGLFKNAQIESLKAVGDRDKIKIHKFIVEYNNYITKKDDYNKKTTAKKTWFSSKNTSVEDIKAIRQFMPESLLPPPDNKKALVKAEWLALSSSKDALDKVYAVAKEELPKTPADRNISVLKDFSAKLKNYNDKKEAYEAALGGKFVSTKQTFLSSLNPFSGRKRISPGEPGGVEMTSTVPSNNPLFGAKPRTGGHRTAKRRRLNKVHQTRKH